MIRELVRELMCFDFFRYWECVNGQPELYDCPNGLVFAGKHRGVTEGCDYPWRANYCEDKQLASKSDGFRRCPPKWDGSKASRYR